MFAGRYSREPFHATRAIDRIEDQLTDVSRHLSSKALAFLFSCLTPLAAWAGDDAEKIRGKGSSDVKVILGIEGRAEMVHRDDLALGHA